MKIIWKVWVVGGPETVAEKFKRHSKALGGIDVLTISNGHSRSYTSAVNAIYRTDRQ